MGRRIPEAQRLPFMKWAYQLTEADIIRIVAQVTRKADVVARERLSGDQQTDLSPEDAPQTAMASRAGDVFGVDAYDAKAFAKAVDEIAKTGISPRKELTLGDTPPVFLAIGATSRQGGMAPSVVAKATKPEVKGHDVRLVDLKNLPALL